MQKVLEILGKWKNRLSSQKYLPKVYVLGATNSGKSTLINALLYKGNKYKHASKIHYR